MIVEAMMSPPPMPLFNLLQLLTLFVSELGSHLAMRVSNDPANPSTCLSSNLPQLSSCGVDDWRNFRELFGGQIKFGAKPFFHSSANSLRMTQFKEMISGV